jgi:transposase InsO family protein
MIPQSRAAATREPLRWPSDQYIKDEARPGLDLPQLSRGPNFHSASALIAMSTLPSWSELSRRRWKVVPDAPRERQAGGPWQNGFAERLIGSIRRECLDHFIVLGEAHLRRILRAYANYYNDIRTHRSLDKDVPIFRPVQRTGSISSRKVLGGLHHHYMRV